MCERVYTCAQVCIYCCYEEAEYDKILDEIIETRQKISY